tara:strand:- start:1256 stop:1645 length:390 start_codon:yes stop_codon:yes gene_type:complete
MARIVGNEGNVTFGTHNITSNAWSMTISRVVNDVTAYGDKSTNVRGGVPTYTGSISGFMSDSAAPNIGNASTDYFETGDTVTVTLTAQTGNTFSGTAVISGVSVSSSKTGDATISFDFTFTGDVTETWG